MSTLRIIPDEYGYDFYEFVDANLIVSEMPSTERRFINGLVRYYEPTSILKLIISQ